MLGKIEGRRRRGRQRMKFLYGIADSMDMNEQAPVDSEGQGSLAYCSPWGHKESDTTEWLNNNTNYNIWQIDCQRGGAQYPLNEWKIPSKPMIIQLWMATSVSRADFWINFVEFWQICISRGGRVGGCEKEMHNRGYQQTKNPQRLESLHSVPKTVQGLV